MFRPRFQPSAQQRAVGRNLALDMVAAIGVGVTVALVTTLLPTIARRGGLEPIGLAALAAAPYIANLLGAFAGRVGPRSPRQLALVRGAGAASLVLLAFVSAAPIIFARTGLAARAAPVEQPSMESSRVTRAWQGVRGADGR